MIDKFHALSRKTMLLAPAYVHIKSEMVPIRTAVKILRYYTRQSEEEQRSEWLERIHRSRQLILDSPNNLWLVYELCKDIYELAEIDRVDFNGSSLMEKMVLIRQIVKFADLEALEEGVTEYHLARNQKNWPMRYLEGVNEHAETIEK